MKFKPWYLLIVAVVLSPLIYFLLPHKHVKETIKVGILHSMTGGMAISEIAVVDATLLAIEEINRAGGVLGRLIEPHIADGKSDSSTFALEAERLINDLKVSVLFGCWTSSSRKAVKAVVEKYNNLLFYPVQYEGLESSSHIIYTGSAPNQQIIPGTRWAYDNLGKKFFLVGSDYVFPRAANEIMKDEIASLEGASVVGEAYIPLGSRDVAAVVAQIKAAAPDVILNTINGEANIDFFKALREAGISSAHTPTMSFSISENELPRIGYEEAADDYLAWGYFQSVQGEPNRDFIEIFKAKYGHNRAINDPMESAYFGVHLWALAATQSGSVEIVEVKEALKNQVYGAPEGIVYIDDQSQHTWKMVRVGKIKVGGSVDVVWRSYQPIKPLPYPTFYREVASWDKFMSDLYTSWGGRWEKE